MDHNEQFLNDLYQNTKMGGETLETLLQSVDDKTMRQDLMDQRQGYSSFSERAKEALLRSNSNLKDVRGMTKFMANSGIKMNTLIDKTPSHIAEMVIQGSTMGIISATEELNEFSDVEKPVRELAQDVVKFEQNNIERMKGYL